MKHDPDALLDYIVDLAQYLEAGDTIVDAEVTVVTGGVVVDASTHTDTEVIIWISGGVARTEALVQVRFTTADGRIDDRTITLEVEHR